MPWIDPWAVIGAAFLATALLLGPLKRGLERRAVLDRPNDRSSHDAPVPRGAGIVVVPVVVLGWAALAGFDNPTLTVLVIALGLAAVGWLDDLHDLPVWPRLLAQLVAAVACIGLLPGEGRIFPGVLPLPLDRLGGLILWLWFINLYNFMDGIDGLTGMATLAIGIGTVLAVFATDMPQIELSGAGGVLAAAAAGFLLWNRPPARIFLGDVGSIGLGFLVGWLLLHLAAQGLWASALLLPLYHLADASFTLALRLSRGEKIWQPSRAHFYQRGAAALGGHAPALVCIAAVQAVLTALAVLAAAVPDFALPAVLAGSLSVGALLWYFAHAGRRANNAVG